MLSKLFVVLIALWCSKCQRRLSVRNPRSSSNLSFVALT